MSTDLTDVLRERNKYLLEQLREQREKLERVSGCSLSRKRGREAEEEEEEEEWRQSEVMVTLTEGHRGPARAALAKPSVRFTDTQKTHKDSHWKSSSSFGTPKHSVPAEPTTLSDSHQNPQDYSTLPDPWSLRMQFSQIRPNRVKKGIHSRVRFQSEESESKPASDRRHVQPLLGYDWIAGVLDTEDSFLERSDEYFNNLSMFRSVNEDECVHSGPAKTLEGSHLFRPLLTGDGKEANIDTHQCTFSYRINSRLFPVPIHSQECCPVCKRHKFSHPHTVAEPALIRVSLPRANILPSYKYKAHRRSSFDPSDSLGLPSHCLSGWSNAGQNILPSARSLDLRSSIKTKNADGPLSQQLEKLSSSRRNQNLEETPDVYRLANFNFQHFSPKRNPRASFFPG
ncbi:migration and invasion inhibitory protein isoform X1 [Xiphophorus couchianus]|uniref:migration and invasion inhibitory protein isoform X1 n=1 Tax=Xiphophorus couchianus TaxID=32473 RepID=UPI001015FC08|nr:migration and invasion-inhibitory protein isoform X1 [Xiphophorus couchianus]